MEVRRYEASDLAALFALMKREGPEWTYNSATNAPKYQQALQHSFVLVGVEAGAVIGYIRCKNDAGFGVYILDLLVDKEFRGQQLGRKLITAVRENFSEEPLYITSDADGYYEKQGFEVVGTLFEVS